MHNLGGIREIVSDLASLAHAKGRVQTFEFELYLLRWQADLAASNSNEVLAGLVRREAAELRNQIEAMTAA